jgi:hypothetical protein
MSADNWAQCPRCTFRGNARLEARAAEVQKLYGAVSVKEFEDARNALAVERTAFEKRPENFREDYEIYGAATGTVTVSYGGTCMDCGLSLSFDHEHQIPDWNKP